MFHDKSNHIEIKYNYIRDMVQKGAVKLQYVVTGEKIVDVLTKALARVKFEYFREKLGVLQIEVPSKGRLWVQKIQMHESHYHMMVGVSSHGVDVRDDTPTII